MGVYFEKLKNDFASIDFRASLVILSLGALLWFLLPAERSYLVVAFVTTLLVAFVAYPWQKEKDRQLKLDEEKRRALSDLLAVAEEYFSTLVEAASVFVPDVPEVRDVRVELKKAAAVAKVYGCEEAANAAVAFGKATKKYSKALVKEKAERKKCSVSKSSGKMVRSAKYKSLIEARHAAYREVSVPRGKLFKSISGNINIEIRVTETSEPNGEEETSA